MASRCEGSVRWCDEAHWQRCFLSHSSSGASIGRLGPAAGRRSNSTRIPATSRPAGRVDRIHGAPTRRHARRGRETHDGGYPPETKETLRAEGRPDGRGRTLRHRRNFPRGWGLGLVDHRDAVPQPISFPTLRVVAPGQLGQAPPPLSVAAIVVPRCGVTPPRCSSSRRFTAPGGAEDSDPSDSGSILRSDSILEIPFADLIDSGAAISVMPSEGGALACGQLLAEPIDGELIIGLSEIDAPATWALPDHRGNEQSIVEVYLAPGLTEATRRLPPRRSRSSPPCSDHRLVEIPAGSTVTWMNNDAIAHEVAFVDIALDDSGPLHQNQEFSQGLRHARHLRVRLRPPSRNDRNGRRQVTPSTANQR